MLRTFISAGFLALTLTAGCVYRIDVPQGNIITPEMKQSLKTGMTKRQVRYVMGTPMIQDPFHSDRWDYVYRLRDGKGKITEEKLTVTFANDRAVKIEPAPSGS